MPHQKEDVHNNVKRVEAETDEDLGKKSLSSRFILIHQIHDNITQKHPAHASAPNIPIDENTIPREANALLRLINSIDLSEHYSSLIATVSKKAAFDLTKNTAAMKQLLQWETLSDDDRLKILTDFHRSMMDHVKNELITCPELSAHFRYATIGLVEEPPEICPITNESISRDGYAVLSHRIWPGCSDVKINTHNSSSFDKAVEAINTIAHETAHVIEGQLAFMHYHNPNFIPDHLQRDAEQNFMRLQYDAYIGSRVLSAYFAQANEKIADIAGNIAGYMTKEAIDHLNPTRPALS